MSEVDGKGQYKLRVLHVDVGIDFSHDDGTTAYEMTTGERRGWKAQKRK